MGGSSASSRSDDSCFMSDDSEAAYDGNDPSAMSNDAITATAWEYDQINAQMEDTTIKWGKKWRICQKNMPFFIFAFERTTSNSLLTSFCCIWQSYLWEPKKTSQKSTATTFHAKQFFSLCSSDSQGLKEFGLKWRDTLGFENPRLLQQSTQWSIRRMTRLTTTWTTINALLRMRHSLHWTLPSVDRLKTKLHVLT